MKNETTKELVMKRIIKLGLALLIASALVPGCENVMEKQPFQAGLGRMVDLEIPGFNLDSHGPGAFLRGLETFSGTATDDVGVTKITVRVNDGAWADVAYNGETTRWEYALDTAALDDQGNRVYLDGPFTLQFKVWDDSGREPLETAKYAFTVKNNPPSLTLDIPYVNGTLLGTDPWSDVETGFNDPDLNKGKDDAPAVKAGKNLTAIPSNGSLIGTIEDLSGIAEGYPQIKFWPTVHDDATGTPRDDADGPSDMGEANAVSMGGEIYWTYDETDPNASVAGDILYGGWHPVEANDVDRKMNNFTFTFPLRKWKSVGGVVTMTNDPLAVGHYRFLIKVKDNLPDSREVVYPIYVAGDAAYPNQYLELHLEAPAAAPVIKLYDVGHPEDATDPGHPAYSTNNSPAAAAATYRNPHQYIDGAAMTYKNGKIYTGDAPDDSFFILRVTASHGDGIRYATLAVRKEEWSGSTPVEFEGTLFGQAPGSNIPITPPANPDDPPADPSRFFIYRAPRNFFTANGNGTYYYTVTAHSKSGVSASETYSITVDTVPPVTRISSILSSYQDSTDERVFTLNGKIMIKGLAYDSDSGIRNPRTESVRYFILKNSGPVKNAGTFQALLDADYAYMGDDYYPAFGYHIEGSPFSTDKNAIETGDVAMFPGGDGEYTIFLLSQDTAYNRSIDKYAVTVDQESDKPKVEVVGMDMTASRAGLQTGNPKGNVINNAYKFTVRLQDDDALDPAPASVKVSITGITNPGSPAESTKTFAAAGITIIRQTNGESRATFEVTQEDIAKALYDGGNPGAGDYTGTQLMDGYYTLTVEVDDTASVLENTEGLPKTPTTGVQKIEFAKNTASPRVTFTDPVAGNYYSGKIEIKGRMEDDGPIDTGYLRIRLPAPLGTANGDWEDAPIVPNATFKDLNGVNPQPADGKYRYEFSVPNVDVGTEANENLVIGLEARDVFERKTANVQVAIRVDTAPPVVSIMDTDIDHLTSVSGRKEYESRPEQYRENNVNGIITVKSYIYDGESGLSDTEAPRLWFLPATNPFGGENPDQAALNSLWDTAGKTDLALVGDKFEVQFNTRNYTSPAEGAYKIHILAKDKAGIIGRSSFEVYLDQSTDKPWLDYETLTPYRSVKYDPNTGNGDYNPLDQNTWAVESVANDGILVSGTVHDDDGLTTANMVQIQYSDDGTGASWKTSAVNTTVAYTSVSETEYQFTYYLPPESKESGFLGGGEGPRKYRLDISDNLAKKQADPVMQSGWLEIGFILDLNAPEITFLPDPPASNPQGPNFDINSTAPFIKGDVKEKYITADHKIYYTMSISPGTSISGSIDLPVTAVDTAADADSDLDNYEWALSYKEFNDLLKETAAQGGAGLHGWYDSTPNAGDGLPDLNYTIKFSVTDDSNSIAIKDWNFSKDSSGPVITFNVDHESTGATEATTHPPTILKAVQPVLKGSFRDANSLTPTADPKFFYYRLDYTGAEDAAPGDVVNWKGAPSDSGSRIAVTGQGSTVNWEIDLSRSANEPNVAYAANKLPDGRHTLDIKVQDALGSWSERYTNDKRIVFKIDTTPPAVDIPSPPSPGVYQIANTTGYQVTLNGTANDALFDHITFEIGKTVETGSITFKGNDTFNNVSTPYTIRYKNPDAADIDANWKTSAKDAWKITGNAASGYLRNVDWRIQLSGALLLSSALSPDPDFQDYLIRVTAHDEAERTARTEWQFRNDKKAPEFELITVTVTGEDSVKRIYLQDSNPRIQATITDPSGVAIVSAKIEKYTYASSGWSDVDIDISLSDLALAAGGETINWNLPLGATGTGAMDLVDGQYRLTVSYTDKAGNSGAITGQFFFVDRNNPVLTIAEPAAASFAKDTVDSVSGEHYIPVKFTANDIYDHDKNATTPSVPPANQIIRVRAKLVPKGDLETSVAWPADSSTAVFKPAAYSDYYTDRIIRAAAELDGEGYIKSGEYTLYVMAEDSGGRSFTASRNFTVDNEKPKVNIDSPYMGDAVNAAAGAYTRVYENIEVFGPRTFEGGVSDNNSVTSVRYFLGQTPPAWEKYLDNGEYKIPAGWLSAGEVRASDSTLLAAWTGTYAWTLDFPEIDEFHNGSHVASALYVGAAPVDPALTEGRTIWEMPLYFRIEDQAGNVGLYRQNLWLDPDGGRPKVFIESHKDQTNGDPPIVGGAIQVSGTATDNYGIFDISFRVKDISTGNYINLSNTDYEPDPRANGLGGASFTGGGWYRYKLSGGLSSISSLSPASWSVTINSNGECNPASGDPSRNVQVEVFAWDSLQDYYQQQGSYYSLVPDTQRLTFSNTAPVIENVKITTASGTYTNANYTAGMKFTGAFRLEAHVWISTTNGPINSITYQGMEMAAAKDLEFAANGTYALPGGAGSVKVDPADYNKIGFTGKKITITGLDPEKLQSQSGSFGVNNASWGADNYTNKADVYYLTLKIVDGNEAHYYAEQRFEFHIDNFFPKAALTGAAAGGSLAGTSAVISGTFTDNDGTNVKNNVAGLQKMVVWFTRSNAGVPLDNNRPSPHSYQTTSMSGRAGDGAASSTAIPQYPLIGPGGDGYEQYYSGISVDFSGESTTDRDKDRYVEFFDPGSGQWSVRLNTEDIGSGPITLNYAVFDEVGNARYYSKDIVIQNFAPQIGAVVVYTDIYGKVAADNTTPVYTPYGAGADLEAARSVPGAVINTIDNAATGVTVRKNYLSFTILVNNGNNGLNYRVRYKGPNGDLSGPEQTLVNQSTGAPAWVTLAFDKTDFGGMADATDAVFEITVWDNIKGAGTSEAEGLKSVRTLKVSLDNTDETDPKVLLHDLNPLLNVSRGAGDAATLAAAAQPGGIDDNRDLPGIYNLGTESVPVPSGHIEPRSTSDLGKELGDPAFTTDTVSGKVIVRGSAFDAHRVKDIVLPGAGPGGGELAILQAVRNSTTSLWELKAVTANTAWVVEEWRLDGHYVEWAWLWDSETAHNGVVAGSVTLEAKAVDAASGTKTASIAVDLAPFILDIKNGGDAVPRSTQGWYSFYRDTTTTYTLSGYNLKKGGNSTLYIGDGHAGSPVNLTAANADVHTLTFKLTAATISGQIVLKTFTGVEAVNSQLEKLNPWNLEQVVQQGRENWDHSRFAHVWRANANDYFAGSNGGSDFAMAVNPNDAGLWASWVNRGLFRTYHSFYDSGSTKNTIYIMTSHDAQKETDVYVNTSIHNGNADTQGTDAELDNGTRQSGVTVAFNNIAAYTQGHGSLNYTGGIVVYDRAAPDYNRQDVNASVYAMEDVANFISNRFNRPRVVTNGSRIHVSYYDNIDKTLRHSTITSGTTNSGAYDPSNAAKTTVDGGSGNIDKNAGAWSAIDYLSDGRPIIAYYSDTAETVKLAYSSSTTYNTSLTWTKGDLLASTDDYYRGSGLYVALRVDRKGTTTNADDVIHVSFYNTANNTLVYAVKTFSAPTASGNGGRGCFNFDSMAVDTGLVGGTWADLSLDPEGNPWITCRDQTGIRVAHRNITGFTKPTVDLLGHDNTGWDSVAAPLSSTTYSVADGRLNIETISAALAGSKGWNAAVGYPSGDYFRVLYRTPRPASGAAAIPGWWED